VIEESAYLRGQRSLIAAKRTAAGRGNLPASRRLCVQDPTHYMNDLGRSCTRTPELQSVFATAYDQLRSACDSWESSREESSILTKALRAKFDGLEKMREQIVHPQTC
jgi:DNA polymerase sigma